VDVAHEIGHKLSLPHLIDNTAPIGLPFQSGVHEQVRLASLVQNLMWEHNPVRLREGTPTEPDLKQSSQWLPQTASRTSGQEVHTVRGGALSPEQVRWMRKSLTTESAWDVDVELREITKLLLDLRTACGEMLKAKVIGDPSSVRKRLRELGVSPYIKDVVLNGARSEMMVAKESGTFDLLAPEEGFELRDLDRRVRTAGTAQPGRLRSWRRRKSSLVQGPASGHFQAQRQLHSTVRRADPQITNGGDESQAVGWLELKLMLEGADGGSAQSGASGPVLPG
jgi:hypothetical protein